MPATSFGAIAGVILAGGESRRMGGNDKARLLLAGRPLLAHVVDRLAPQVPRLAVNSNDPLPAIADLPLLPDASTKRVGPLAGVLAGLNWAATLPSARAIVTVPVDTPFIPTELVRALAMGAGDGQTIAIARSRGVPHPVVGLFPITLRDDLAAWLATARDTAVRTWIARHRSTAVDFPDAADGGDPFFNINTPDDLARAAERLASSA